MIGFGTSTMTEGVTGAFGLGYGEGGINPGREAARDLGGDWGAMVYSGAEIATCVAVGRLIPAGGIGSAAGATQKTMAARQAMVAARTPAELAKRALKARVLGNTRTFSKGTKASNFGTHALREQRWKSIFSNRAISSGSNWGRGVATNRLATGPDRAVFWSGLGRNGPATAANLATRQGRATLETTLSTRGVKLPRWEVSNPASVAAWRQASHSFGAGATGHVRVLQGGAVRINSVWAKVEFAALKANPNVKSITGVHAKTGEEMLLWSR